MTLRNPPSIAKAARHLFVLCALLCSVSCIPPDPSGGADAGTSTRDMASESVEISVATYNVRRLFDATCDSNRCGSNDFEAAPSTDEYRARLDEISVGVEALDADVVLLQEIENRQVLADLAETIDGDYEVAIFGESGGAASLDVAVLARGTFLEAETHGDTVLERPDGSTTSFARELLEVHFTFEGHRVIAFSSHFTSKLSEDPGRRLAEAEETARRALAAGREHPDALVVVGGDLNDDPDSEPIRSMADAGLDVLTDDRPFDSVWTYQYFDEKKQLDYLMVLPRSSIEVLTESVSSLRSTGQRGLGGSDHAALRATLLVN